MPVTGPGVYQLRVLSRKLREAGTEGQGLRRELYKAVTEAAKPLVQEIRDPANLQPYMPTRYAGVLASDIAVTATKSTNRNPGVAIRAKGRTKKRKVKRLNDQGILTHPVFGDRDKWVDQTARVKAGFFADPCQRAAPAIRDRVIEAMHEVGRKITSP